MWYRKYYKLAVCILCIAALIFGFCTQRKNQISERLRVNPKFCAKSQLFDNFFIAK